MASPESNTKRNSSLPKNITKPTLVLCRYSGYGYWPALATSSDGKGKYNCEFIEDKSFAIIPSDKIIKYHPDYAKIVKLPKTEPLYKDFKLAVKSANLLWFQQGCPPKQGTNADFDLFYNVNMDSLGAPVEKKVENGRE